MNRISLSNESLSPREGGYSDQPKEPKRPYLDSLRGLAAIVVVSTHFLEAFYPHAVFGGKYPQQSSLESLFHYPPLSLAVAGNFAVCLFFVLSGFVLTNGHMQPQPGSKLFKAMIKRPIRLGGMVAFSVFAGFVLLTCGCFCNSKVSELTGSQPWFSSFWSEPVSLSQFVNDFAFRLFSTSESYNPPMWTILKELKGSYIVFLYLLSRTHLNAIQRATVLAILFLFMRNSLYVGFVIGLIFAELDRLPIIDRVRSFPKCMLGTLLFGLLVGMQPYYLDSSPTSSGILSVLSRFGTGGFSMTGAILVFGSVLWSAKIQHGLNHRTLRYLGSVSYAMYALHFLLLGSLTSWIYLNLVGVLGHFLAALFAVLATLPVLAVLSHFVTKTIDKRSNALSNWVANKLMPDERILVRENEFELNQDGIASGCIDVTRSNKPGSSTYRAIDGAC